MTQPGDAWAFLDPWFARLRGCVSVDSPSRVDTDGALVFGRDPETDWWLRVDGGLPYKRHERPTGGNPTTSQQQPRRSPVSLDALVAQVRARREALVLVGALASVDNAAWVHKLRTLSAFVAPTFMDLSEFTSPHWNVLACWLQRDGYSDEFKRDYKLLLDQVEARADAESLQSISPRLRFRFMSRDEPFILFIESMLTSHLQEVDANPDLPGMSLDSLELKVLCMWREPSVPGVLRRIMELGVPIDHLDLSVVLQTAEGDRVSAAWRESYVRFVRTLCGHDESPRGRTGGVVRKLTIPDIEVTHPDFDLLCSGLQHSRGVHHFAIGPGGDVLATDPLNPFPPGVWELIALALVSRDSTTSVEALSVRGVPITLEDTEGVFNMISLIYPMEAYVTQWVRNTHLQSPKNKSPRRVFIPRGTTVSSYYGFAEEEYSIDLEQDTEAFVTFEDAGVGRVLIPGRGFCRVACSDLPSKRLRPTPRRRVVDEWTSSLLKSLEIVTHPLDETSQAQVKEFLQFAIGSSAQRLRLKIPNLGEQEIRDVLEMCPNVEYLAVSDVAMPSMTAFEDARTAGVRLKALELQHLQVPDQPLTEYLRGVLARKDHRHEDDGSALVGLRLGQVSDAVLEQLRASLEDSAVQYLDYTIMKPIQQNFIRLAHEHNRRATGDVLAPLSPSNTMAFLGSIRFLATTRPEFDLTDEIKALIVNFASIPKTRIVVCRQVSPVA